MRTGATYVASDKESRSRPSSGTDSSGSGLQDRVTAAIRAAFITELAEVGYGRLSVDAIARRARVGKAAIYRRWPGKQEMAVALVSSYAVDALGVPDTGSLRGDVEHFLSEAHAALAHPVVNRVIPDLLAEAVRNPDLAQELRDSVQLPRRTAMAHLIERAITRGELPPDCDVERGLDILAGPLYWRVVVLREELDRDELVALSDVTVAALGASRRPSSAG